MSLSLLDGRADVVFFPERRGTKRFPLQEEVRYKLWNGNVVSTGVGKTLNIGSSGALFTTEQRLPVGCVVELSVNWPARLNGTCLLKFVATGRIVRAEEDRAALRIERYEFRTRAQAEPRHFTEIGRSGYGPASPGSPTRSTAFHGFDGCQV